MDEGTKELLRYGATFIALLTLFFGGTYIMKQTLGTENPMMVVISQSMVPTLGVGDFIFIQSITDFDTINAGPPSEGDILVFLRPGVDDEYIVHRAIASVNTSNGWVYTTKGDNNSFQDGSPVPESRVIGKVINRLPIVGYFSLFIKTMKGFSLVAFFMGVSFFYDYVLPKTDANAQEGKFNPLALVPFSVAVIVLVMIYFNPVNVKLMEYVALFSWYLGCIILPLAVNDDDMGLMIWLYHLVLIMIPIACDLVWWTTHITPSVWWDFHGSIVPVTWLLLEESAVFNRAFWIIVRYLLPGTFLFLFNMYAKRKGIEPLRRFSNLLRGI
ncbi:MAG: signal peptidase I [Candidatus Bathyarchaeota archaeon]|nr:signal peptidase I [Candidatus Bathyarchaeota archaeon]